MRFSLKRNIVVPMKSIFNIYMILLTGCTFFDKLYLSKFRQGSNSNDIRESYGLGAKDN